MIHTRLAIFGILTLALALGAAVPTLVAQDKKADKKTDKKTEKKKEVWTDPEDPTLPVDFKFQGEFFGQKPGGMSMGCQVIALGGGEFQAVVLPGGLPGLGWDGKNKSLMAGKLVGDHVEFTPIGIKEQRNYIAKPPAKFSATAKFPPVGHMELSGMLAGDTLRLSDGFEMRKLVRKSATLGRKAPEGALVLFDGSNKDAWNGGRIDKKTGFLNTDGGEVTTKKKFNNYSAHVEFYLPFRPDERGQGRGNSGFYQVDHYEVQILDSFGLEGKNNECSGIYTRVAPSINQCRPPLQWQTYDVDFTNAVADESGKKVKNARISVRFNGHLVHDNVEIAGTTGGARNEPEGTPGILRLQGHGNPLQFRNIWVVEKK